jgi:uncharacterized damage-inducible protein DinB
MLSIFELYEYSSRVRRKFANKLAELPWEEVIKNREASFYSMKNILVHMIDNEDWIVNWVINNKALEYKREKKSEDYRSMSEVLDHLNNVESKTRSYLKKALATGTGSSTEDSNEFKRRVNFVLQSSGKSFDLSVEESLFQSFTEQLYHLGEIIALLWQQNVEPPQMQWFWNNPRQGGTS